MTNPPQTGFLGAVGRFFFSPGDPTTLGFMRIMTGLLLLYVHAAYTLDLKSFLGPHAWWDQRAGNIQRREMPVMPPPLDWTQFERTIWIDETPHRRAAEIEFFRSLPSDPRERAAKLRYLRRIFELRPADMGEGLNLSNSAAKIIDASQDKRVRDALEMAEVPQTGTPVHIPAFLRYLQPKERLAAWEELLTFNATLPEDSDKQEYILTWLSNYPLREKIKLYQFLSGELIVDGKNMSLPADPRERGEFLEFLERWGGDSRQASHKGTAVFSHWYHLTDPTTMWLVHLATLVVFLLFTIGLFTRVTSVMSWALSLTYIHRGQISLFGQDTMQTILITYLMIAPSGATLSIDAIRARFRAAKAKLATGGKPVAWADAVLNGPQPSWLANFAQRLFQINFCLIYMSSGVSKLKGSTWWEHSAPWLVLVNPEFGLVRYRSYEWFIRELTESRFLISAIAGGLSVFTLMLEIGLPILVWTRLRPLMVIFAVMLHLGIAIIMGLAVFSMYMFTLLLCYFPAKLIRDRVAWSPGSGRKMTLRYDSRDPLAVRKAALVAALDVASQVALVDTAGKGHEEETIHLTDPEGRQVEGHELFQVALRELVLVKPIRFLGYVPGVWELISWRFGR